MRRRGVRVVEHTTVGQRIILFFVPTILLVISIFGVLSINIYRRYIVDLARDNLVARSERLQSDLAFRFDTYRNIMNQVTARGGVVEALMQCRDGGGSPVESFECYLLMNPILDVFYEPGDHVIRFYLNEPYLPQDGRYIRYSGDYPFPEVYDDLVSGRRGFQIDLLDEAVGEAEVRVLVLARAFTDRVGNPMGVVSIEVAVDVFRRAIGETGVGNLAWYRFFLADGPTIATSGERPPDLPAAEVISTVVDSSGATVEVGFQPETLRRLGQAQRNALAGVALAFVLVSFLITLGLARVTSNRIRRFVSRLDSFALGSGELQPIEGSDEVAQIDATFRSLIERLRAEIANEQALVQRKNQVESELLLAQLNPHFLYNTLSSIRWRLLSSGDEEAGRSIDSMIAYYRTMLSDGRRTIAVSREIDLIREYVRIQQFTYEQEYEVRYEISPGVAQIEVPKMLLQPFVENAVRHGVYKLGRPALIVVRATRDDDTIRFVVEDNGRGMTGDVRAALNGGSDPADARGVRVGYGVYSVMRRLRVEFGSAACVRYDAADPGTRVTITFPVPRVSAPRDVNSD